MLWRSIIIRLCIREYPNLYVIKRQFDRESCVGFQGVEILGGYVFARGYVCGTCDQAHRDWVTRTSLDLLAVGDRLASRRAEIDEVISGRQRGSRAGGGVVQAVTFRALGKYIWIQALKEVSRIFPGRK